MGCCDKGRFRTLRAPRRHRLKDDKQGYAENEREGETPLVQATCWTRVLRLVDAGRRKMGEWSEVGKGSLGSEVFRRVDWLMLGKFVHRHIHVFTVS